MPRRAKPPPKPDPVSAIKVMMEGRSLKPNDLLVVFKTRGRVSEVLNYKRRLTLDQIRELHNRFGMDASVLIQMY